MKKYLAYSLLVAVLFGNSGAGCGSKNADDPQPDKFQSLIGKWQLERVVSEGIKHSGKVINNTSDVKKNGGVYVYEFFSDGRLRATGDGKSRDVRWELSVVQADVNGDINNGTLKIIGDEERQLAKLLGQSGDLTYDIGIIGHKNDPTAMYLSVDATKLEADEYKKLVLTYIYHKL
ncbi:hypothetical protein [Spirosoma areae]